MLAGHMSPPTINRLCIRWIRLQCGPEGAKTLLVSNLNARWVKPQD